MSDNACYRQESSIREAEGNLKLRLNSSVLPLILIFSVLLPATAAAQAALTLTVTPEVSPAGRPVTLEAVLTNDSDKPMDFELGFSCGFDLSLQITIRDSKGNQPPETRLFRRAKNEGIEKEPRHSAVVCGGNSGLHEVRPHDTLKTSVELSRFYKLDQPETYTVQVSRTDVQQVGVSSNPVTFTVVPNPRYTPEIPCTVSGSVTVTVTDASGTFITNALVILKPEGGDVKQFSTSSAGIARASMPCGYVDVFVGKDTFLPYAQQVLLEQAQTSLTVVLNQ